MRTPGSSRPSWWIKSNAGDSIREKPNFVLIRDNLKDAADIPTYAEPWFLTFNAEVEFHPAMSPQDLERSGIDRLSKKWR